MQRTLSSLKAFQWKHLAPHSNRLILHVILMILLIVNSETNNTEHWSARCPLLGLAPSQLYALELICTQQSHLKKHFFFAGCRCWYNCIAGRIVGLGYKSEHGADWGAEFRPRGRSEQLLPSSIAVILCSPRMVQEKQLLQALQCLENLADIDFQAREVDISGTAFNISHRFCTSATELYWNFSGIKLVLHNW